MDSKKEKLENLAGFPKIGSVLGSPLFTVWFGSWSADNTVAGVDAVGQADAGGGGGGTA